MKIDYLLDSCDAVVNEYVYLMNENYRNDEAGIWKESATRTNPIEIRQSIEAREIIVIHDGAKIVGGAKIKMISATEVEFSMMSLDKYYRGTGISGKLIHFMETESRKKGAEKIRFEVLRPSSRNFFGLLTSGPDH
jgi:Acetyltransferase (GNAT) domain